MSKIINKTVNENGLKEIAVFLAEFHKNGACFNSENLGAWADEANTALAETGTAHIEISEHDSVSGRTELYFISDAGLDINEIHCNE